jgi:predicted TPR repeat methyltransferase
VFIYLGDLDAVFAAVARALVPGGLFAFSVEGADGDGYRLLLSGRYAHSIPYLRALAARHGLSERGFEHARLRREGAGYAHGWLAALAKPAATNASPR